VHDTGILAVLDAKTGAELFKVRIGGGGHTFSASPVAAGKRIYFLTENGTTIVLESAGHYKEIARNDLDEMSLASPAIAGGAIYIRTATKLYKIGRCAIQVSLSRTATRQSDRHSSRGVQESSRRRARSH
jgi:hypothetical protein